MQELFEQSIEDDRFNLNTVYSNIFLNHFYIKDLIRTQKNNLDLLIGTSDSKKVIKHLIRYSFYIEPVKKPKIETTKYAVRWADELIDDPRFASYVTCLAIFDICLTNLLIDLNDPEKQRLLKAIVNNCKVSYEIPIDYIDRTTNPIHTVDNISWCWGELPSKLIKLRTYLTDNTKHTYAVFFKGVYKKIQTKTYLTDRVLTGAHKTNREKRWECHPLSVHFSLRKVAWEIELKLMQQVCHFVSFPQDLKNQLIADQIMVFNEEPSKCPITFEPLSFLAFKNEIENLTHGKSDFQVGHMNPLKADLDGDTGHSSENISWISEQGNRIQGSNSVEFIHEFVIKVYKNYRSANMPDTD
jgi:hypothetical protein